MQIQICILFFKTWTVHELFTNCLECEYSPIKTPLKTTKNARSAQTTDFWIILSSAWFHVEGVKGRFSCTYVILFHCCCWFLYITLLSVYLHEWGECSLVMVCIWQHLPLLLLSVAQLISPVTCGDKRWKYKSTHHSWGEHTHTHTHIHTYVFRDWVKLQLFSFF